MTHTPGPWVAVEWHGIWSVDMPEGESSPHRIEVFHPAANTPDNIAADARLIAAAPTMAEALLWIRENLHPKALGRGATDAELLAITHATMVLRQAGVIPMPELLEAEP